MAKIFLGGDFHYNFVIILTKDGELWGAGYGDHGQLGRWEHAPTNNTFKKIAMPFKRKVVDVCFVGYGDQSSTLVLLDDGRVLGAGINTNGQLGVHGSNLQNSTVFTPVIF